MRERSQGHHDERERWQVKRLAAPALAVVMILSLGACGTSNNDFTMENGVCYRTRTVHRLGIQVSKDKVLAVPENCGVTTTIAPR